MSIKTRRYCKRNNKSRRTRKNKTTRRYKKQMRGGGEYSIQNEEQLKASWDDRKYVAFWVCDNGTGNRTKIYSKGLTYEQFREEINYFLNKVIKGQDGAFIRVIK